MEAILRARAEGQPVKVRGTGHSFTDAACTDGVMISLDRCDGIVSVDPGGGTVTVQAGITLRALNGFLARHALAMSNLGDIAYQSVAGATQTATHGTGLRFGNLSTQIRRVRLVDGCGTIHELSADHDPEAFQAARAGLGALGVVTEVTIDVEPAFDLLAVEEPRDLDDLLPRLDELAEAEEHFEFYWLPHTPRTLTKRNVRTREPRSTRSVWKSFRNEVLLANAAIGALCRIGRARPSLIPALNARFAAEFGRTRVIDRSDRVFTSPRYLRFAEMEYAIPRAAATEALQRLRRMIDETGLRVSLPVEVRFVAADDIFLSPSYERQTCYIAVHMYRGTDYRPYFSQVERIMLPLGGRPHWGKLHGLRADVLSGLYPAWDRFLAVRDRLDPDRTFANAYLDRVLGP